MVPSILAFILSTVTIPGETYVSLPEMYSVRTGIAVDKNYSCQMSEVIDDVEFPGTCPITSIGTEE